MKRFDQNQLMSRLIECGELHAERIDSLAEQVAAFHASIPADVDGECGTPEVIREFAEQNFEAIHDCECRSLDREQIDPLYDWTRTECTQRNDLLHSRKAGGFIRECHGDMHLGNMVAEGDGVLIFDCIEFNERLRWIDVIDEAAFVMMDLEDRGRADYAMQFLNRYLAHSGDYAGLRLLPFYLVYRAMVRAKVAMLRWRQIDPESDEASDTVAECRGYLDLAQRYSQPRVPTLSITHGLSGSGKTTGSQRILEERGAIRIRTDIERKRVLGIDIDESTHPDDREHAYSREVTQETYDRVQAMARQVLEAGFPVIADATFLKRTHRDAFHRLADELGVPFQILDFEADESTLRKRIQQRQKSSHDASEADLRVLERQIATEEPLEADELPFVSKGDSSKSGAATAVRIRVGLSLAPLLVLMMYSVCPADSSTAKYFAELRRRRLFRLAEGVCSRRLSRERVSPELRGQLTFELSRTYTEHAKYLLGAEQTEYWSRARKVIADRIQNDGELPERLRYRLRMQSVIVDVLEAEFFLWRSRLLPDDATLAKQARAKLSTTIAELQTLQKEFDRAYRRANSRRLRSTAQAELATELKPLQRLLDYQLGITLINYAEAMPKGSSERKSAVSDAESLLRNFATGAAADEIAWNSRILLVAGARLADRGELVARRLKAIERMKPPLSIIDRTMAERVKVFLDIKRPMEADDALTTYEKTRGGLPGELAFLRVKTDLILWSVASRNNKQAAARLFLKHAESNAAEAERTLGGYWGYRCRVLLANSRDEQSFGPQLAIAIRQARALQRHQKPNEAAKAFSDAIALAEKNGRNEVAGDLGFTLGSILLGLKQHEAAAEAFHKIAVRNRNHPRAADAHLMWAYCLGRSYNADRTHARRLAYTDALEEHRKLYAGKPTAAEATWMQAMLEEYRRQLTVALKLYLTIPADHKRGTAAQVAAARCLEGILVRLRELKRTQDLHAWEDYAVDQLGKIVRGYRAAPVRLNLLQAEVAMRCARIQLNRSQPDYRQADALLERVFTSAPKHDAKAGKTDSETAGGQLNKDWSALVQLALQLRIVSLAGRGQIEQARTAMQRLSNAGASEILAILDGLMQLTPGGDEQARRELGLLQLQAAVDLDRKRQGLSAKEQLWLDRCLAQAYASAGQTRRAIEYYEKLLAKSPNNLALRKTTATLLLQSNEKSHLIKAKNYWRRIERSEKKGSREWLNARLQTALALYRLREFAECRKLLNVTRLLYPQLGDAELRRKYEDLIAKTKS
eukprot:g26667.t1